MHFLAVALVYAAADSSKDSDTTLTEEVKKINDLFNTSLKPLMTELLFNNLLFFFIVQPTDIGQVWVVLSHGREHPASQNRRSSGNRKPFASKQHFSFRAEVESRSTKVHNKSSHLWRGQWLLKHRVKLQISGYHPEVMRFYVRLTKEDNSPTFKNILFAFW